MKTTDYSQSFNQYVFNEAREKTLCLDVGCFNGNLGRALIEKKQCVVDGVDFAKEALNIAKKRGYRNVFLADLNKETPTLSEKYQTIIFADVLEHLISPEETISFFKGYLTGEGRVVISLPNVAFVLNRLLLLCGNWNYKEYGTLDKTHLRFFTIKSGVKMVENCGFEILKIKPYNQFDALKTINPLVKVFPSLFSYQFLIVAKVK